MTSAETSSGQGSNSDRMSTPWRTRSRRPRSRSARRARCAGRMTSVKDRVMGVASDVDGLDARRDRARRRRIRRCPQKVASGTRGNPIAVGLIAFGVGWLAASLIPASKVEQRAAEQAKDAAAPLLDEVKDVAAGDRRPPSRAGEECRRCGQGSRRRGRRHRHGRGRGCGRGRAERSEARRRESPVVGRPGVDDRTADPRPARDSARDPASAPCRRPASMASTRFEGRISCSSAARRSLPDGFSHLQARAPARCSVGFDRLIPSGDLLGEGDLVARRASVIGVLTRAFVGLRRADLWVGHECSSHGSSDRTHAVDASSRPCPST